jgi:hypothetical protein
MWLRQKLMQLLHQHQYPIWRPRKLLRASQRQPSPQQRLRAMWRPHQQWLNRSPSGLQLQWAGARVLVIAHIVAMSTWTTPSSAASAVARGIKWLPTVLPRTEGRCQHSRTCRPAGCAIAVSTSAALDIEPKWFHHKPNVVQIAKLIAQLYFFFATTNESYAAAQRICERLYASRLAFQHGNRAVTHIVC